MHRFLRNSALIFSAAAIALTPSALRAGDDGGKFKIAKKNPLEGGGRWDYVTVDPEAHRVYIARATHVTVLDSESGAVVGDIPDTPAYMASLSLRTSASVLSAKAELPRLPSSI
jgi:phosphatidate phosphatase APP1